MTETLKAIWQLFVYVFLINKAVMLLGLGVVRQQCNDRGHEILDDIGIFKGMERDKRWEFLLMLYLVGGITLVICILGFGSWIFGEEIVIATIGGWFLF